MNSGDNKEDRGKCIRDKRLEKKLTRKDMSRYTGLSIHAVFKIERYGNPTLNSLWLIADVLGVEMDELIGRCVKTPDRTVRRDESKPKEKTKKKTKHSVWPGRKGGGIL